MLKRIELTEKEKAALELNLKQTNEAVNAHNRSCVILGYNNGFSPETLSKLLHLSLSTIYNYLTDYNSEQKTNNKSRGGSSSKLNKEQSQDLMDHLKEYTYSKVNNICRYVKEQYAIGYSRSGMTDWLKDHGFVYKKPKKVPGKLNPAQQEAFIETYEALKKDLKPKEEIYFIDALHPAYQSQAAFGWIQKGEQKTLKTTGKQMSLHINGALCLEGMKTITEEYKTIDGDAMVDFLRKIENSTTADRIYVIMDNARSNKNKKIEAYLKDARVEIRYLPPYSPNLNPIERLWKVMREKTTHNRYYESSALFFEEIRKFFQQDVPQQAPNWTKRIKVHFQSIKLNPIKTVF